MKTFLLALIIFLLAVISPKAAIVSSNLFTLTAVNNATNGGLIVNIGSVQMPQTTFAIQNLGLTATNALAVDIYMGLGPTTNNMAIVGTYYPSITNAQIDSYVQTNSGVVPIYCSVIVRTTNNVSAAVSAIKSQ